MSQYGPTPEEAAQIARACGCRIVQIHELPDGEYAFSIDAQKHANKVKLLAELAAYDARTPEVRRAAELAAAGCRNADEQIKALHAYVKQRVTFTKEPIETFSPTMHVLDVGMGDCDDSARAMMALGGALGHRMGCATLPSKSSGKPPLHVAAIVRHDGAWRWLETSLDAMAYEHPIEAAKRLGVTARKDLTG